VVVASVVVASVVAASVVAASVVAASVVAASVVVQVWLCKCCCCKCGCCKCGCCKCGCASVPALVWEARQCNKHTNKGSFFKQLLLTGPCSHIGLAQHISRSCIEMKCVAA